ncbi:hypothetical protein Cfor_01315 [Coptotermes formosanus]|uniref:3-hydroxy-3-methylglutaryl-coenzyme A reductase n=1 Tax=Coptotermes formosanus TaxID=36987 RepID=A0A6L2PRF7_COPFO|nr:hypothetical protein Cfor_01315 [Coptotermes formosanus]
MDPYQLQRVHHVAPGDLAQRLEFSSCLSGCRPLHRYNLFSDEVQFSQDCVNLMCGQVRILTALWKVTFSCVTLTLCAVVYDQLVGPFIFESRPRVARILSVCDSNATVVRLKVRAHWSASDASDESDEPEYLCGVSSRRCALAADYQRLEYKTALCKTALDEVIQYCTYTSFASFQTAAVRRFFSCDSMCIQYHRLRRSTGQEAKSLYLVRMVGWLFRAHGELCASHPWEVIVATLTLTVCMMTVDQRPVGLRPDPNMGCGWRNNCAGLEDYNAADVIVMTIIRCVAVLYSYYQFCHLQKLGSKYILGIAGLFTVFSSFVFSSSVINFLGSDVSDLKDALFFFLLLIDLSKATVLAQFALSSQSQDEVKHNIARGIAVLGPTITLDTVVETLVIGVGTLSGVRRLEVLCCFACMSVIVNYIVFMTFYPACLSLILELSRSGESDRPAWHDKSLIMRALREEDQKPNPVVQRVKVIMSAGLMLVHVHSRWSFASEGEDLPVVNLVNGDSAVTSNSTDDVLLQGYILKWLTVSADHIVILILLLALAVKFVFFEVKDGLTSMHRPGSYARTHSRLLGVEGWVEVSDHPQAEDTVVVPTEHKSVQTEQDEPICQTSMCGLLEEENKEALTSHLEPPTEDRSVEECLGIYKSEAGGRVLRDSEVMTLVAHGHIPSHQLEKAVGNPERGVCIRRKILNRTAKLNDALTYLPYLHYDYSKVMGACCENVIGYMPVPVGVAGPLLLDGCLVHVPLATTEGCLVASTNRGSRALMRCGVSSRIVADGMTRGPVVRFPNISRASEAMLWMQEPQNFEAIKESFNSTSRFARLSKIHIRVASRHLFIRFVATTGDAMGMNMLSKGK